MKLAKEKTGVLFSGLENEYRRPKNAHDMLDIPHWLPPMASPPSEPDTEGRKCCEDANADDLFCSCWQANFRLTGRERKRAREKLRERDGHCTQS
jgi:hypothetical protein